MSKPVILHCRTVYCRKMMTWGYSQHWSDTLAEFTGDSTYNTSALLAYFKPLENYLDEYLANNSINAGWDETACPNAPDFYIPPEPTGTTIEPTTNNKPSAATTPKTTEKPITPVNSIDGLKGVNIVHRTHGFTLT